MSRTDERKREETTEAHAPEIVNTEAKAARVEEVVTTQTTTRRGRTALVAVVALAIIAMLAFALWFFMARESGGAGRPVPAPRTVSLPQQSTTETVTTSTEQTITLAPDVAARAGIKIEPAGEQLATEGAGATVASTGTVQANAYRSTPVVSLVGGIVRQVNVELGQTVRRGQTVAVVFSDELAMAQSKYLAALAMLEEHHKHHARAMQLVEIGAMSREELEQATTQLRTAEADVASMRQRLLLLGLSAERIGALRSSSQISSEVSLPAPISGTVVGRAANPNEVVEANKELLRIADLSSVWVIGQVYEKDLGRIRTGSGASITSDAFPGRVFRGRVSYVDPSLDAATRTAQVRVELANLGQALKLGMYVRLAFVTLGGSEMTAPTIPAAAVQQINNQQVVFVATNDPNIFVMRPVRLGPETNGRFQVLEGLTVGERIVTDGSFMLRAEWQKTVGSRQ